MRRLPDRIYHLAEAANRASIERDGLLSASRLMDRAGLLGAERERFEREQRRAHTVLPDGTHLRDQRPMPPAALRACLVELSPAEWYAAINSRVFFWLDADRRDRQRRACGARAQVVLAIDTERLLRAHGECIALTPINTGNARRKPARRAAATFVPYAQWLASAWAGEAAALGIRERPRSHRPVELTVEHAVPDVVRFVVEVLELPAGRSFAAAR